MTSIMEFGGVRGYVDENDVVQLNLEDVSRGLGFTTETVSATSGRNYINVRWARVKGHLVNFGLLASVEDEAPEYISEPYFYWLAMKAGNKTAEDFQKKVCFEILPAIRKHGQYYLPGKGYAPLQYLGPASAMINTLRRIMIAQNCTPQEIAQMAQMICRVYGIPLPENFVKEDPYKQIMLPQVTMTVSLPPM